MEELNKRTSELSSNSCQRAPAVWAQKDLWKRRIFWALKTKGATEWRETDSLYQMIDIIDADHEKLFRCFAAAGPKLWNSLPTGLRQTNIGYEQFKRRLKTFVWALRSRCIVTKCHIAPLKFSYLLTSVHSILAHFCLFQGTSTSSFPYAWGNPWFR